MTDADTLCRSTSKRITTTAFHLKDHAGSSRERTHAKKELKRMNNNIVMIKRSQLHPHPDNPRKDLGDLEELKESIRAHGVMQNLTVVPDSEGYKILIGHRRFAASDGILDELPCVISEGLTDREQVGIMLVENMQRSDLTVFEQAHGFQMMLDLGDTVETIADKTGFSKQTVKHRIEISKLDKKAIDEAQEFFQLTISDYIELEKVKDIEKRNEILSSVESSRHLKDEVEDYLDELKSEANEKKYKELCLSLGFKEVKEYIYTYGSDAKYKSIEGLSRIRLIDDYDDSKIKELTAKITEPIVFRCDGWGLEFAIKKPDAKNKTEKKKSKEELLNEAREKNKKVLEDMRTIVCDEYFKCITEAPQSKFDELGDKTRIVMMEELFKILLNIESNITQFKTIYTIKTNQDIKTLNDDFKDFPMIKKLMLNVWAALASSYANKFVEWNYTKNMKVLEAHQSFAKILKHFGLKLHEEPQAIIDGTSIFYNVEVK